MFLVRALVLELDQLGWVIHMQVSRRVGSKTRVLVEQITRHVTVMATKTSKCALHLAAIDVLALARDRLQDGIDVVIALRLVVAIVPCMVIIEPMPTATTVAPTMVEVEDKATAIADGVQIVPTAPVGAQAPDLKGTIFLLQAPNG